LIQVWNSSRSRSWLAKSRLEPFTVPKYKPSRKGAAVG
jgi:hypothetical protein